MSYGEMDRRVVQGQVDIPGLNILKSGERCGDGDRDKTVRYLGRMHASGYIGAEEFDTRMALASEADNRARLSQLTSDLPAPPAAVSREVKPWQKGTAGFLAGATAAIGGPVVIYGYTGYYSTIKDSSDLAYLHPAWAVLLMVLAAVAGIAGFVCSIAYLVDKYDN